MIILKILSYGSEIETVPSIKCCVFMRPTVSLLLLSAYHPKGGNVHEVLLFVVFPLFFLFFVNYTTKVEGFLKKSLRKMGYGTEGSVIGMKRANTHLLFPNLLFYIRNTTFYSCKVPANIANTPSYLAVKVCKKQCGDSS